MAAAKKTVKTPQAEMVEAVEANVEKVQDQMQKFYADTNKTYEEMAALGQENMRVLMNANSVALRGFETLGKEVMAFVKANVETGVQNVQVLAKAKTPKEAIELQSDFAKAQFDSMMAETAKLTEMSIQVANEVFEPIKTQADATLDKVMKQTAA